VSAQDESSIADGKLRIASTDPDEVRALYDSWADRYDGDVDAWDYRTPTDVAELLREAQPEAAHVLDVGCGTGRTGRALRAAGFTSVVGCDLSPNALEHAWATGTYERVVEVDLQQLPTPFADDAFDAVNCVGVLTYLPDSEAILREFLRLVRPVGTVVFSQREDIWAERDCSELIGRLVAEGLCEALHVSEPRPYLPKSDEMRDVGVVLCVLRKRARESRSLRD
jgi:predicted TPR repeat methyltransferase